MNGREVLVEIVRDEKLKHLPVIILTNSQTDKDELQSYQFPASSYLRKPIDFEQFVEAVKRMVAYCIG